MGNTVSIRIAGNSTSKCINQLAHDLRIKKVDYLKNDGQKNLLVAPNENVIFSQNESDQVLFEKLKQEIIISAKEQKEIHEKVVKQKSQIKNYFINGIITFSEDMKKDFYENQKKFQELAKKTLADISKKYGIKLLHFTIHLDEKTPHIHFTFENVNRSTGRSVQRYITKSDLRNLQTETAAHWQEMGYKRGKENSKSKHYSVAIGHQKEELEDLKTEIQRRKKEVKAQELESSEKKADLDKLDILLKQTRESIKEVKNCTVIDEQIAIDIDNLIKNSKKVFVLNEEKLRTNLKEKFKEYSKNDFKSLQEKKALKRVNVLENENNSLVDKYNALVEDYNQIQNENEDLHEDNILLQDKNIILENENQELKEDIADLEKEYKFNLKDFKKNIKSLYQKTVENRELRRQ